MAKVEEIFVIKDINTNKYVKTNAEGELIFTPSFTEATEYSYAVAELAIQTTGIEFWDIPKGYYKIEKIFKKS